MGRPYNAGIKDQIRVNAIAKSVASKKSDKAHMVDPTTCDNIAYSRDEWEFMKAVDEYKRTKLRPFPTLKEVFGILKALGYAKQ